MAGTFIGVYSCLIVMVGVVFAWWKTGDSLFGALFVVGIITLGAHIILMKKMK
jgi:hypothetical protein